MKSLYEIRKSRSLLEEDISLFLETAVHDFQLNTGVLVKGISVEFLPFATVNGKSKLLANVKVKLEDI